MRPHAERGAEHLRVAGTPGELECLLDVSLRDLGSSRAELQSREVEADVRPAVVHRRLDRVQAQLFEERPCPIEVVAPEQSPGVVVLRALDRAQDQGFASAPPRTRALPRIRLPAPRRRAASRDSRRVRGRGSGAPGPCRSGRASRPRRHARSRRRTRRERVAPRRAPRGARRAPHRFLPAPRASRPRRDRDRRWRRPSRATSRSRPPGPGPRGSRSIASLISSPPRTASPTSVRSRPGTAGAARAADGVGRVGQGERELGELGRRRMGCPANRRGRRRSRARPRLLHPGLQPQPRDGAPAARARSTRPTRLAWISRIRSAPAASTIAAASSGCVNRAVPRDRSRTAASIAGPSSTGPTERSLEDRRPRARGRPRRQGGHRARPAAARRAAPGRATGESAGTGRVPGGESPAPLADRAGELEREERVPARALLELAEQRSRGADSRAAGGGSRPARRA